MCACRHIRQLEKATERLTNIVVKNIHPMHERLMLQGTILECHLRIERMASKCQRARTAALRMDYFTRGETREHPVSVTYIIPLSSTCNL